MPWSHVPATLPLTEELLYQVCWDPVRLSDSPWQKCPCLLPLYRSPVSCVLVLLFFSAGRESHSKQNSEPGVRQSAVNVWKDFWWRRAKWWVEPSYLSRVIFRWNLGERSERLRLWEHLGVWCNDPWEYLALQFLAPTNSAGTLVVFAFPCSATNSFKYLLRF